MQLNFAAGAAVLRGLPSVYAPAPFCDSRHIDNKRLTVACHSIGLCLTGMESND